MVNQIYFFSCLFLISSGIRLSFERFNTLLKFDFVYQESFLKNGPLNRVFAVCTMLFGILQILKPQDVSVVGDVIPALFSIIGGLVLLLQGVNKEYKGERKFLIWTQSFLKTNVAIIGLLMIISGLIHAVFPTVVLL